MILCRPHNNEIMYELYYTCQENTIDYIESLPSLLDIVTRFNSGAKVVSPFFVHVGN